MNKRLLTWSRKPKEGDCSENGMTMAGCWTTDFCFICGSKARDESTAVPIARSHSSVWKSFHFWCSFDVYLLFIATINSKKLPKTTNSSSLRNGLDKPLFEITKDYGEVDSPFVINRSWVRVPSLAPKKTAWISHFWAYPCGSLYAKNRFDVYLMFIDVCFAV